MLHVFASDNLKFGDTFYVHIPSFLEKTKNLALLEWFDTIHFVEKIKVPRHPIPTKFHNHDSQVDAIKEYDFSKAPVVQFCRDQPNFAIPTVNLWRQETKAVIPMTPGASTVIVPREAKNYVNTQVYDYPVIDRTYRNTVKDPLLDIVFISNGEVNAEYNYEKLKFYAGDRNRITRVNNVKGRVAAYHAAARASRTPWFFAVFAKLEVEPNFDWSWHPDCLQQPKHYIFHARNPVNGLVYGHQAMIAYNKDLVLNNPGRGLDFTLDDAHEVVPVISGTAYYCNDPWTGWRTAFRETLKLKQATDIESQYRLTKWLTKNNTDDYVKWSHIGAQDAVEYYESVDGAFDELKKSYEWEWLASYAFVKHNLLPK